MSELYSFSEPELLAFFLVLIRMSAFVVSWPAFGVETVPAPIKILFALVLSILVFPVVDWSQAQVALAENQIFWLGLREAFIGVSLGFIARLFFFAIRICGELISISMGLSGAQLFNPALGGQVTAIEQFQVILATLFFLAINGHHLFLTAIVDSFRVVPIKVEGINFSHMAAFGQAVQEVVSIGLKLAGPVLLSILFVNLCMAVIGRAVPQINVLITSLPVNIMIGFFVMIITIPLMLWQMHDILELTSTRMFQFLRSY